MTSMAAIASTATRRLKWHYQQPPQTPRILHLPRRPPRRKVPKSHLKKPTSGLEKKGKLEALFDQERAFSRDSVPIVLFDYGGDSGGRRERVEVEESRNGSGTVVEEEEEEKRKFQAEVLRAECNLLRMEREIAVKKFERTKDQTEGALKSAIEILSSGQKQICEGKNEKMVLEEAILDLGEKLVKLQKSSAAANDEVQNPTNFDKHSNLLKKRLEKIGKADETQELATKKASTKTRHWLDRSSDPNCNDKLTVDILKSKMEGLSNGTLLERMKHECGSMLSTASSSLASSASNSKRIDFSDSSFSKQKTHQDTTSTDHYICSRRCKAIIRRIIEQVGEETEQWSQMQEMLSHVREEMEELQNSRVFWKDRAISSDVQIQSLRSEVEEWRERACSSENKVNELEGQISILGEEVERLRINKRNKLRTRTQSNPNETQNEMEKRVLVCRTRSFYDNDRKLNVFKDDSIASRRSPLGDIGNTSMPVRRDMKLIPCSRYGS